MARVPPLFLDGHSGPDDFDVESTDNTASRTLDPLAQYQVSRKLGTSTCLVTEVNNNKDEYKVLRRLDLDLNGTDETTLKKTKVKLKRMQRDFFHQNIVRIHDVLEVESNIHVVSEYCEGGTLHGVITRAKKEDEILNEIEVMDWVVEILRALQHIHDRDCVAGNVSATNILLKNNSIKLNCVRELSRSLAKEEGGDSQVSSSLGTLCLEDIEDEECISDNKNLQCYSSPEIELGDPPTDRSDIWAAGCLIYELCHQKRYTARSEKELPEYYPSQLSQLWKRMIEFDPEKRPTAFELLEDRFLLEHAQEMELPVFTFREPPQESRLQNVFEQCETHYADSPDIEDEAWLGSVITKTPSPAPDTDS